MAKTFEGWDEEVWAEWVIKLRGLSIEQLDKLADATGVSFVERKPIDKEAYILVLDEADQAVLELEYQKVILKK